MHYICIHMERTGTAMICSAHKGDSIPDRPAEQQPDLQWRVINFASRNLAIDCRSQQLADLLDLPTDNMTDDPATPKGEQTAYNGVYILQQPKNEAPKKSRFGTREQV